MVFNRTKTMSRLFFGVCFLISFGLSTQLCAERQASKLIDINRLHLYRVLNEFRGVIAHHAQVNNNAVKDNGVLWIAFLTPLDLVEDAIARMNAIVALFNSDDFYGYERQYRNLEIQYKFVNVCNLLKDVQKVEPRHLRQLRAKLVEFDQYIQAYCLREKYFLKPAEIDLFNEIVLFNRIVLEYLLKDEYLSLTFSDKCIDFIYRQPSEYVRKNGWIISMVALTVAGISIYRVKR